MYISVCLKCFEIYIYFFEKGKTVNYHLKIRKNSVIEKAQNHTMPNYENGKIYKLTNNVDSRIYVGSTCSALRFRLHGHKGDSGRRSSTLYNHVNSLSWANFRIILLENFPCSNKDELNAREQYYIDLLKPSLNSFTAINNCPHNSARQDTCKLCKGKGICSHNVIKNRCKYCSPHRAICNICEVWSPNISNLKRHQKTTKHIYNFINY